MTPSSRARLRELAEEATPGPWAQCTAPDTNNKQAVCDHFFEFIARTDVYSIHSDDICEANAAFIAAANPQTVIALLDEIERLRQREPTREEMEHFLGDRDEIPAGDPYPEGWPTIRRCRHCKAPVPGGPTACVKCVELAEVERLRKLVAAARALNGDWHPNARVVIDQLARALLAVLPVIRAADAWRDAAPYNREDRWYNDQLENEVDTMRAALAKEQG